VYRGGPITHGGVVWAPPPHRGPSCVHVARYRALFTRVLSAHQRGMGAIVGHFLQIITSNRVSRS
jgi:hypothetical protein